MVDSFTEFDYYSNLAFLLEEYEASRDLKAVAPQLMLLLDTLFKAGRFDILVGSQWGRFQPLVADYFISAAEQRTDVDNDVINKVPFDTAFAYFLKRGDFPHAVGAVARFATFCEFYALRLRRNESEPYILQLLVTATQYWAFALSLSELLAKSLVGAAEGAPEGSAPQDVVTGRWGLISGDSQYFTVGEDAEITWSHVEIVRAYATALAREELCVDIRRGSAYPGTLSDKVVKTGPEPWSFKPSVVADLAPLQLVDLLSRRGDVETALSLCKECGLFPSSVIRALVAQLVFCLDTLLNAAQSTLPIKTLSYPKAMVILCQTQPRFRLSTEKMQAMLSHYGVAQDDSVNGSYFSAVAMEAQVCDHYLHLISKMVASSAAVGLAVPHQPRGDSAAQLLVNNTSEALGPSVALEVMLSCLAVVAMATATNDSRSGAAMFEARSDRMTLYRAAKTHLRRYSDAVQDQTEFLIRAAADFGLEDILKELLAPQQGVIKVRLGHIADILADEPRQK